MDQFIGEIRAFPYTYAPEHWIRCHGALLPISQFTALFSLLGTQFGGDGNSTFAVPDLTGRCVIGAGTGPGLTDRHFAQPCGVNAVALATAQMPAHTHQVYGFDVDAETNEPSTTVMLAKGKGFGSFAFKFYASDPDAGKTMGAATIGTAGGGQAHDNQQPYLNMNFFISTVGVYPTSS